MKKLALSIVAIAALAFGTVNVTKADTITPTEVSTTLTNISTINKIEIHGNVQVFISDGQQDQVRVYNRYYAENALVQSQNGVLRISSYSNEKLVVWVTAADLRSITAYDNSEVRSFGILSEIGLDVSLFDSSSASLNLASYSATIKVSDHAKANLSGTVSECELDYDHTATVNQAKFTAENLTQKVKNETPVRTESEELAGM